MSTEENLVRLRDNIARLSYTADNCDIVMTNEYTGKIWFDLRTITLEKEPLSIQEDIEDIERDQSAIDNIKQNRELVKTLATKTHEQLLKIYGLHITRSKRLLGTIDTIPSC